MKKQFTLKKNYSREWAICDEEGKPAVDGLCFGGMNQLFGIPEGTEQLVLTISTEKAKGMLCVLWGEGEDFVTFPCTDTGYSPYILRKVRASIMEALDVDAVHYPTSGRPSRTLLLYVKLEVPVVTMKKVPLMEEVDI